MRGGHFASAEGNCRGEGSSEGSAFRRYLFQRELQRNRSGAMRLPVGAAAGLLREARKKQQGTERREDGSGCTGCAHT